MTNRRRSLPAPAVAASAALVLAALARTVDISAGQPQYVARHVAGSGVGGGTVTIQCTNQTDCTDELQHALDDERAAVVVVKFAEARRWVTRPLRLNRSNVHLVLEHGVELLARRGFYHGDHDSLLTISKAANVSVEGPGKIRMWREDYANATLYTKAEWRAGLNILDSTNVTVRHLTLENTGGDGVYIVDARDSLLFNVTTDGAYRNGPSPGVHGRDGGRRVDWLWWMGASKRREGAVQRCRQSQSRPYGETESVARHTIVVRRSHSGHAHCIARANGVLHRELTSEPARRGIAF